MKRLDEFTRFLVELVFVGVNHIVSCRGRFPDALERARVEQVIVVEKTDKLAAGLIKGRIRGRADPAPLSQSDLESRTDIRKLFQQSPRVAVIRAVIGNAPFPICECLTEQGNGRFGKPLRFRVERWSNDTKHGRFRDAPRVFGKARLEQLDCLFRTEADEPWQFCRLILLAIIRAELTGAFADQLVLVEWLPLPAERDRFQRYF